MAALDVHITGLARGSTLPEQLSNRRRNMGLSLLVTATRAGLTASTISRVEAGGGTIASLVKLLSILGGARLGRRKPQYVPLTPLAHGERDKRFTPTAFLGLIEEVWGEIDLDPCWHPECSVQARHHISLHKGGDGLRDEWTGRLVFLNPPFSQSIRWLERADEMWGAGKVEIVVALVPARTDGRFFHHRISKVCDVGFLPGRMHFDRGEAERDKGNRAPFSMMVCIWGARSEEIERFGSISSCLWLAKPLGRLHGESATLSTKAMPEANEEHCSVLCPD